MENLNPNKHAIKFARTLGSRKKITLVEYAQNKGFKVLNLGISQAELDELESLAEADFSDLDDDDLFDDDEISLDDLDNITD